MEVREAVCKAFGLDLREPLNALVPLCKKHWMEYYRLTHIKGLA